MHTWIKRYAGNEKGFTLIELMVVVIILGVLAAIAVPNFTGQTDRAKKGRAITELKSMKTIIDLYKMDNNEFPEVGNTVADEVNTIAEVLQKDGINWTGDSDGIKDPWGNPYTYAVNDDKDKYVVFSMGPDGDAGDNDSNKDNIYVTKDKNPTEGAHDIAYSEDVESAD
ncbi:MAG: type II secretion system major pseudopilin GspG [Thermoanaerobacterales bacterium]|nr:type II secretion system major pseudopilin GspG [Thermoanaerobacterales bacterium]